ncbi:hypothetical protein [Paracoccus mutanolyticus]|uniref:hypothetical protein n=1 Tax=Paracoccus mutanolyticus TaxID=1499308 RepID=UPI00167250DA|nr:hypothetical protein [Paracoccus mutanolyticus]
MDRAAYEIAMKRCAISNPINVKISQFGIEFIRGFGEAMAPTNYASDRHAAASDKRSASDKTRVPVEMADVARTASAPELPESDRKRATSADHARRPDRLIPRECLSARPGAVESIARDGLPLAPIPLERAETAASTDTVPVSCCRISNAVSVSMPQPCAAPWKRPSAFRCHRRLELEDRL